jgi:ribulose-5-phosphate 4-epimerase/fuculose-1-phosphate aldolase
MTRQEAIHTLLSVPDFFAHHGAGYSSWGKVTVRQAAVRFDRNQFAFLSFSDHQISTEKEVLINPTEQKNIAALFAHRKRIDVILITEQLYAAQVREEIPPILDDQAQLLGVSVRLAKTENEVVKSLKGRFAAILPRQKSICLGHSLEDAFVAAQLLEKTAKVFIEAKVLGGAKPINRLEAWVMQQYYQLKYSKEASKNK